MSWWEWKDKPIYSSVHVTAVYNIYKQMKQQIFFSCISDKQFIYILPSSVVAPS